MFLRAIISGLGIALCLGAAEPTQRHVAEWIIRQGGSLTVDGRADPIGRMEDLPAGEPLIRGVNLVGTLVEPTDLRRFSGLTGLRELELPGPQWNPNAGSKLDANDEFEAIANLTGSRSCTSVCIS